jgi:hypothetical protein
MAANYWGTAATWAKDNPELVAAIVSALGGVASNATAKKGDLRFKAQPETPEELAYRRYAESLAGMHGQPGPTYSYLAPQIHNMLGNLGAQSAAYQPLQRLDMNGQPIARAPVATTPMDFSSLPQPWAQPVASIGSAATTPSTPPPPPDVSKEVNAARKSRKKTALKSTLGGLLGGLVGGAGSATGYGAAAGALIGETQGMKKGKQTNQQRWDAAWAPYNEWKALYGNAFTDAAGRPVKAPTNLAEYNAWYLSKYGTPPPTGGR